MNKIPIGDAFEERSQEARLLVIYGTKLARLDHKNLIFECRDIQGRVRYKFCLSSMRRSGVILNLSQEFITDLFVPAFSHWRWRRHVTQRFFDQPYFEAAQLACKILS